MIDIINGNCVDVMKDLPKKYFNTVITSPPYWGLRDYGNLEQLGQEETPEEFVKNLVNVFREVKRVLRDDGTVWLNLGDTFCTKNKNLLGIPWRVAFALQSDGWYLRQDIIWHKPNPMPESVKDRCTKAHEYIFLFSKNPKYYFDNDAIREKNTSRESQNKMPKKKSVLDPIYKNGKKIVFFRPNLPPQKKFVDFIRSRVGMNELIEETKISKDTVCHWYRYDSSGFSYPTPEDWEIAKQYILDQNMPKLFEESTEEFDEIDFGLTFIDKKEPPQWRNEEAICNNPLGKNKRSVWTINVKPFKDSHFAVFPIELIEPCVLAGCPKNGNILDPFGGSGTTGVVAKHLKRNATIIELNKEYIEIAKKRITEMCQ